MSILKERELIKIRKLKDIRPDTGDTLIEVWRLPGNTVPGGGGVDEGGGQVTSGTVAVQNRYLFATYPARLSTKDKATDRDFGGQPATVGQWKITFPYYVPGSSPDEPTVILDTDQLLVAEDAWTASTAVVAGAIRQPAVSNGYAYRATKAGTTGATAPTWPTGTDFDVGIWVAATAFRVGDTIKPANLRYRVTVAGTTGASTPVFPTNALATVTDGTVTWQLTESVADGTTAWQLMKPLRAFEVIDPGGEGTYRVLQKVLAKEIQP